MKEERQGDRARENEAVAVVAVEKSVWVEEKTVFETADDDLKVVDDCDDKE